MPVVAVGLAVVVAVVGIPAFTGAQVVTPAATAPTTVAATATPGILDDARGVVSLGHDEYFSVPMRDALEEARDAGTNLAFLGANVAYWRIRFADAGQTIISYKSAIRDPVQSPTATALWRSGPDARPESLLTGMLYECFPARGAFTVGDPTFFVFKGTGARRGSSYAGVNSGETDRAYPGRYAPKTLQIVAHSPTQCAQKPARTYTDMTYYTVKSGAGVLAAGSMAWVWVVRGASTTWGIDKVQCRFHPAGDGQPASGYGAGAAGPNPSVRPERVRH